MKTQARTYYHSTLWPAVCARQGWAPNDSQRRRTVCLDAMFLVKGPPVTTSSPAFGDGETTALFTYLRHLADPDNITLLQRWTDCQADYIAFNTARQADYWQQQAYGRAGGRMLSRRFSGRKRAEGDAIGEDPLDRKSAADRLMTMRARATRRYTLHK